MHQSIWPVQTNTLFASLSGWAGEPRGYIAAAGTEMPTYNNPLGRNHTRENNDVRKSSSFLPSDINN